MAAPSANRAGAVSPTTADHVVETLGEQVDLVVDGGPCPIGIESTVLDVSVDPPRILRPGGATRAAIEAEIGEIAVAETASPSEGEIRSPGRLVSHYAPARPLRPDATSVAPDEALLAFGPRPLEGAARTLNLSPRGDVREAAANLFAMMRDLDRPEFRTIAVMPIPTEGLGEAIRDRLTRAAAPRDGHPPSDIE